MKKRRFFGVLLCITMLIGQLSMPAYIVAGNDDSFTPPNESDLDWRLSVYTSYAQGNEFIQEYSINGNILCFDTAKGPLITLDYIKKEILSFSFDDRESVELRDCKVEGNVIEVNVYSSEAGGEHVYRFDRTISSFKLEDVVNSCKISDGIIEFDSDYGPQWKIDYINKKVIECTSSNPHMFECIVENNQLKLLLMSDEFAILNRYVFDLDKTFSTKEKCYIDSINIDEYGYDREKIHVMINDPNNEIGKVEIVNADNFTQIETLQYDSLNDYYFGSVPTGKCKMELRAYIGTEGNYSNYYRKDVYQYRKSSSSRTINIKAETDGKDIIGTVSVSPYYPIDNYSLWTGAGNEDGWEYGTCQKLSSIGEASVRTTSESIIDGERYYYYAKLTDAVDSKCIIADDGLSQKKYFVAGEKPSGTPTAGPVASPTISVTPTTAPTGTITPTVAATPTPTGSITLTPTVTPTGKPSVSPTQKVTPDNDFYIAPQYYIDDNGKYPFAFSIDDADIGKVILTINGVSKEYSEDDYQEDVFFNGGGIYYGGFGKSDIKVDFNLQGPGEYKAHVKAWDKYIRQGDSYSKIVLDEDIDIHFVMPEPVSYEQYVSVFDESIVLEVIVPVKWSDCRVANLLLSKNGKTYAGYSMLNDYIFPRQDWWGIYDGSEYGWRFDGLEYNYYDLFSLTGTGFSEVMEAGDYDFVLELSDGNSMTFSDNIHITHKAVVQNYDHWSSAFDCSGEYYYVRIQGINIMDSDIEALIVDDKGVVCSSFVEKFFYDGQVIYKLKKTGAALNPSSTDTFYIDLIGDYIDARGGGRHGIIRERKEAYGIYADPEIDIYPSQTIWNWKTNRLEYRFNSSVPAGSEIVLNIYSGRNDDWELTDDLILATAKATVEDNRFAYFSLLDKEGNICNLLDIWKENGCFWSGIEAKVIGCGTEAKCPLSFRDPYNINKPYRELTLSVMKILDPGFNYCNKKISFYAYGPSGSHKTNELYARIEGIDEQISLAINEEKSKDVFDYFGGEVEAVKNTLTEGVHKIEVFEKINGEEKSLCTGNILVRNKDKLYTNYQTPWIYHDHAEIFINGESIIPARDISSADLKRKMEEKGFKLEIFDDSYNIVKDIAYEVKVRAGETLVLYVTGISDYSKDYYFRISMNGYTPIRIQDGKELYEDKAHGQFGGLHNHFYSNWKVPRGFDIPLPSDNGIYNPFYKFSLSSYEDNLPYIAYFYEEGIPEKLVSSIMIDNSKIENGCYYLTEEDVKNLDVKKIYHCELVAGNKSSNYAAGYFTYAVREKQEEDDEDIPVESVSINKPDKNTLLVGDTLQLSAIVSPSNASNKAVKWKSSKASVATVNDDGLVTAVAKGDAIITVSTVSGNKTDSFKVIVNPAVIAVTGVSVSPNSVDLTVGETKDLTATVTPEDATNKNVSWSSSAEDIVTVSANGVITAVSAGEATITVKTEDGEFTDTCTVKVNPVVVAVTGVSVSPNSVELTVGDTKDLTATVTPSDATNKNVTWTSSAEDIVTVSSNGVIIAVAVGEATITVKTEDGEFTDTCTVKVNPVVAAVTGVSVSPNSVELTVGETKDLTATVTPSDATNKNVMWSSSAENIVTVSSNGVITAVAAGEATITVKTEDGEFTDTCTVKVNPVIIAVTGVSVSPEELVIVIGDTNELTAMVSPADASDKSVSWNSADPGIAMVDDNGVITGVSSGKTTITVITNDGGYTASCEVTVKKKYVSVNGVRINEGSTISLNPGEEKQLSATVLPSDADDKTVTWSSSDDKVVTVSANGLIKAVADSGSAVITVTTADGLKTAECRIDIINKTDYIYAEFVDGNEYVYTGSPITPAVRVFNGDEELVYGVDYNVTYKNNTNVAKDPKKTASVTITGKTFAGGMTQNFTILPADLNDVDVSCSDIIRIRKNSKPVPEIYYKNIKLAAKDYDVTYDAGANKGKYTADGSLIITGKGNFEGSREFIVLITTPVKIKVTKFKVSARTYNGVSQLLDPSEYELVVNKKLLTEGEDYAVEYLTDTVNAGTVKVAFIGMGEYTGSVIKTYKINPNKNVTPTVNVDAGVAYTPTGAYPAVSVMLNNQELELGRDYKLTYSSNKSITDKAKVTVSFTGNYKGVKSIAKTFAITAPDITAAGGEVYCADMVYIKAAKYLSTPYVNVNGVVIAKGDYNVTYRINGNDVSKARIDDSYFAAGNTVKVDVTIDFNKKTPKFTGTLETSYEIVKPAVYDKTKDLSKAKITIIDSETGKKTTNLLYTGQPVELGGRYKLTVTIGSGKNVVTLVEGTDFEIIKDSYSNNINKGKATVVIRAKDDCGYFGSKVVNYNITNNKGLSWF